MQRAAFKNPHEFGAKPRIEPGRLDKVRLGFLAHRRHRIDGDDASLPPREVSELQRLQSAAHADVQDRIIRFQVARIDSRAAAVVHFQHDRRHAQIGQAPHGRLRAAQASIGLFRGLFVNVFNGLQIAWHFGLCSRIRQNAGSRPLPSRSGERGYVIIS